MNKRVLIVGAVITLPLLLLLARAFTFDPHTIDSPLIGREAPSFTLTDVQTGAPLSLASLKGTPVVLNFWATWCVPCKAEHPVLQNAARTLSDKVRFVGVIYDDRPELITDYLKDHGAAYPTLVDDGGKTAIAYGVYGVPETFFISESGVIQSKYAGPLNAPMLFEHLRGIAPLN